MSANGNKFLVAGFPDIFSFKKNPSWFVETDKNYEEFLNLQRLSLMERKEFVESLKDKEAEGLAVLKSSNSYTFECDFYNQDGSQAEMCGNLSCCLIFYAWETGLTQNETFYFMLGEEKVKAFRYSGKYWAGITEPSSIKSGFSVEFQGTTVSYNFVSPGVPHGVVEWKDQLVPSVLRPLALKLRHKNPIDEKAGMNVTFLSVQRDHSPEAITFERGVEDWTKSCGTGAIAAAMVFSHKYPLFQKRNVIPVKMPGGVLEVLINPSLALFSRAKWGYI